MLLLSFEYSTQTHSYLVVEGHTSKQEVPSENFQFLKLKKSLFIAWAGFPNAGFENY